jgi:hypothetical protein
MGQTGLALWNKQQGVIGNFLRPRHNQFMKWFFYNTGICSICFI